MACLGCGRGDQPICSKCWPQSNLHLSEFLGRPRVSACDYQDLKGFLLPYKDQSLTVLSKLLGSMVVDSLGELERRISVKGRITLVYPPSSLQNWRKRGFNPAELILRSAIMQLPPGRWRLKKAFRFARKVGDQGALSREERQANVEASLVSQISNERAIVVFDDVAATGSTLAEMSRALEVADNRIVGYCLLSESFLKTNSPTAS